MYAVRVEWCIMSVLEKVQPFVRSVMEVEQKHVQIVLERDLILVVHVMVRERQCN